MRKGICLKMQSHIEKLYKPQHNYESRIKKEKVKDDLKCMCNGWFKGKDTFKNTLVHKITI